MSIYFTDEAQHRAAHVVHYTRLTNNTRRSLTNSTSNNEIVTCDFGNFDKKLSASTLCFQGYVAGYDNSASGITLNLKVGATYDGNYITSGGVGTGYPIAHYNYTADGGLKIIYISGSITTFTGTGSTNVLLGHRSANGSGARPFVTLNPNASDDLRIENSMGGSSLSIWELNL
tara:strand:- start:448 stop:969 length:522 start_codon:yes stop_codon:yes gene_type:complete